MTEPRIYTTADEEPDAPPGTIAVVHLGDYQRQEVWVSSGSNIGNWYPLGGEYWAVWDRKHMPPGVTMQHPHWEDVVARGPVVLMTAVASDAYDQGWKDGRQRLRYQIEDLLDEERDAPEPDDPAPSTPEPDLTVGCRVMRRDESLPGGLPPAVGRVLEIVKGEALVRWGMETEWELVASLRVLSETDGGDPR